MTDIIKREKEVDINDPKSDQTYALIIDDDENFITDFSTMLSRCSIKSFSAKDIINIEK
jgi:hypothetical protein